MTKKKEEKIYVYFFCKYFINYPLERKNKNKTKHLYCLIKRQMCMKTFFFIIIIINRK